MVINHQLIAQHKQIHEDSCVPMSVECVLKLLGLMRQGDFSFQYDPSKSGQSNWVKGLRYPAINPIVEFNREFMLSDYGVSSDRGQHFMENYFFKLFERIDEELNHNRFVIISLSSGYNRWHNEVIFEKIGESDYKTLTFYHRTDGVQILTHKLKERVQQMEGTDILVYKFV